MSGLTRLDPWRLWFDHRLLSFGGEPSGWQPAADVFEDNEGVSFKFDVPGVDPKAISVKLENGVLTVKGERRFESEENRSGFHRAERAYGNFERSFSLPNRLDVERISADTKNGVLRIFIPKREEAKPRTVEVKVAELN